MYIKNKIGQPSIKEGKDGDLKFRKDFGGKSSVFGKVGGIWEKIGLNVEGNPNTGNIALFNNKNSLYGTGKLAFKKNTLDCNSKLKVGTIDAATSDTDKFLVSDSGVLKYRTGTEVLSDIGAGDITGVTITTDSGSGSKAEDTAGSADFSLLGSNGVGVTNSGTTITAVAVPAEIDHDSLNNFASNEHYTQANIIATGALDSGSITSGFTSIDVGSGAITTTGTISGGTINGSAIWQEWVFNTNRGVADRYYYRDNDDLDDWRRWDQYSTLSGSNISISSNIIPGQFVIPEDCTIKEMYGQVMNSGSTACPTITIWYGNPSDGSAVTMTSAGAAQPNSGSALISLKNYEVSKTDFDTDLSAGDIVVPTVHYGTGSLQSFIGSLTVKFVTR